MSDSSARFEFRVFGHCFEAQDRRLRALARCERITESREIYLVGHRSIRARNVKIRDGRLGLKRLLECRDGMERWEPSGQWDFPVSLNVLGGVLNSLAGAELELDLPARVSLEDLLRFVARPEVALHRADLFKRRFMFTVRACRAEFDQLMVNGAAIASVAVESEDLLAALALRGALNLGEHENVSYPLALSRIVGLEPWPEEQVHG